MTGHVTVDHLSLFLDAALPEAERRRVEEHLGDCPECRHRLDGLGRVVAGLGRLQTAAPPDDMAARVAREVHLRGRRSSWQRILDGAMPGPLLGSPPIHLLALVLALGAIVYLFAVGLELRRERPTRIVPVGTATLILAEEPTPPAGEGERLHLLGGTFRRAGGVWVEQGLAERAPDSRVRLDSTDLPPSPSRAIADLARLDAPVRLRVGSEVVEIAFEPGPPAE